MSQEEEFVFDSAIVHTKFKPTLTVSSPSAASRSGRGFASMSASWTFGAPAAAFVFWLNCEESVSDRSVQRLT
jgi:hypothetical protein